MPLSIRCPNPACGKQLKAKDELAGKRLKCPGCGTAIQVPFAGAAGVPLQPTAGMAVAPPVQQPQLLTPLAVGPPVQAPLAPAVVPAPQPMPQMGGTPLEMQWQNSPLLSRGAFLVRQKMWVRKYGPEYNISLPGSDQGLGEANISAGVLLILLGLFKLHDFLPRWMKITDASGTVAWLKIVKVVNNRYDLYDPSRKECLGSLKTIFSTTVAFRVLDPNGTDVGEVVGASLPGVGNASWFGYNIKTADGRKLGDVTSEMHDFFRRSGKRNYSGAKGYVGTVAKEFAGDPKTKLLVLAATIAARMENMGAMQFDPMSVK